MANIADLIENYILQKLAAEQKKPIVLRRADIATAIECAPSQISYVLNTRFTAEKGFSVESRRGLGGFIKITYHPNSNDLIFQKLHQKIDVNTTSEDLHRLLKYMLQNALVTRREAALIAHSIDSFYENMTPNMRANFAHSCLEIIANFKGE